MRLAILWAAGFCARVTLLAIPPLIPAMHHDLVLDETAVGALTGLPVLLLSLGALGGSLLVARLGARNAAAVGLSIVGVAGALRGLGPSVPWLFAMTIVMGLGVALAQPALPSLVAAWEGHNVGRATASYGNGMLVGEIAAAGLTATVLLPIAGGAWEGALALWSVPVVAVALVLLSQPEVEKPAVPPEWWPDWRDRRIWFIGPAVGAASLAYWSGNAHLPDLLHATGHGGDVPAALASLNGMQLPSSLLIAAWPTAFVGMGWPFVVSGVVTVACALGLLATGGAGSVAWAGALGFVSALVFLLGLALPPLLAPRDDVHRFSAAIITVTYAFAFFGALVAGALWDASGIAPLVLAPTIFAGALMAFLGARLRRSDGR